jgi:hypothetical protein
MNIAGSSPGFTPYVGVAPGTTTMALAGRFDCIGCSSLGVQRQQAWNPYVDEVAMRGLGQVKTKIRWDLFALALGVSFAGVLAWSQWGRK